MSGEYWVPTTKSQLVEWLKMIYPKKNWASMPKDQLYAVYFRIRNGVNNRPASQIGEIPMKYCPKCLSTAHKKEHSFCYNDGTKLVDMKKCGCGYEITPFDKFCPQCGKQLKEIEKEDV